MSVLQPEALQQHLQSHAGHHTAGRSTQGSQSHHNTSGTATYGHHAEASPAEHSLVSSQANASHICSDRQLKAAQHDAATSSSQVVSCQQDAAPVKHAVPAQNHCRKTQPGQSGRVKLLPINRAPESETSPSNSFKQKRARPLEPGLATAADGMANMHNPTCSSPCQSSHRSRANMPRSVRLWMERRATSSEPASPHVNRAHVPAHEWSQPAQQDDHTPKLDHATLAAEPNDSLEGLLDQCRAERLVNGNEHKFSHSAHLQQAARSVPSSASSHTRLEECSTDWIVGEDAGRNSKAARQLDGSGRESDSCCSACSTTEASWENDSRTGSSHAASDPAIVANQQEALGSHSLATLPVTCTTSSSKLFSEAISVSRPDNAGIRPAEKANLTGKVQQNVRRRRTNGVQMGRQAFR